MAQFALSPCRSSRWGRLSAVALLVCVLAPPSLAQDGPQDFADEAMAQLSKAIRSYDLPAVEEAIDDLDGVYDRLEPDEAKRVCKAVAKVFDMKTRSAPGDLAPRDLGEGGQWGSDEEYEDPRLELLGCYMLAVGLLYDKPEGRSLLPGALKKGHVKKWADVRAVFIEALGYAADPEDLKLLSGYLEDDHPEVVATAARALGRYEDADLEVRRAAVAELVDVYGDLYRAAEKEAKKKSDGPMREKLGIVEGSFEGALEQLTRQRLSEAPAWTEWFKKVGKKESGW